MGRPRTPVREHGIDLAVLEDWLHRVGVGGGPLNDVRPLTGGTQNLLLRFRLDGQDLVLRHPPLRKRPESDATLRREMWVLGVLDATPVPTARLRAACADSSVLGSAFYVTDFVEGFNPAEGFPPEFGPQRQAEVGLRMVDALAELGRVPIDGLVAAGFRSPDGWLERQPERWSRQLTGYGVPDLVPAGERLAAWLRANGPRRWQAGLIHGDYHLGNVLVQPDAPRLAAVVDWELATLGAPLLDLAHLLVGWPVGNPGSAHAELDAPGLPERAAMVERYRSAGVDVHDLGWFSVLACLRLGVLLEGTHARAHAGVVSAELGDQFHGLATHLFARGAQLVDGELPA